MMRISPEYASYFEPENSAPHGGSRFSLAGIRVNCMSDAAHSVRKPVPTISSAQPVGPFQRREFGRAFPLLAMSGGFSS